MERIYLDNNATTALDPSVFAVMVEQLKGYPSNPSSSHFFGQEAKKKLTRARHDIAALFQVKPSEILFTSGGTEGINFLLHLFRNREKPHIISSTIEHPSLFQCLHSLKKEGSALSLISPGEGGAPTLSQIERAWREDTGLIALSAANSETGVKIDLPSIAKFAKENGTSLIIDGVGLLGRDHLSLPEGVSAAAFSGHKIHGPTGVGFVICKGKHQGEPLIRGGGQERGFRSGTENLVGILGLCKALEVTFAKPFESIEKMRHLRDLLEDKLITSCPSIQINGTFPRVANTSSLYIPGIDGESLLIHLDRLGIAISHGSACSAGSLQPSRILLEMGLSQERARHSIRISLSRYTTKGEIERASFHILSLLENFSLLG